MTTYKTINTENKIIEGYKVTIKSIEKAIETGNNRPLIVNYFECLLDGKNVGPHEVNRRQLDWMLNTKNISEYAKI